MARLAGIRSDLRIGWRNLGRSKRRTALCWAAIALAQLAMVWACSFMNGYSEMLFKALTGPLLGHMQIHAPKYRDDGDAGRFIRESGAFTARLAGLPHVARVSARVFGAVLATQKDLGHVAQVTGLDFDTEAVEGGLLRGVKKGDLPAQGELLAGEDLAREMGLKTGDTLALMGQAADGSIASGLYLVKGIIHTPSDAINRLGLVMGLAAARDLLAMPGAAHELVVYADHPENIPSMAAEIQALGGMENLDVKTWDLLAPQLAALVKMLESSNLFILVLVFITTVAGVANTMLMATFERSHEFGMLLALGMKPSRLKRMLLVESLVLGLAGALLGTAVGLALCWISGGVDLASFGGAAGARTLDVEGMSLDLKLPLLVRPLDAALGVAGVLVTSLLATLWPARRVGRMDPAEALRS